MVIADTPFPACWYGGELPGYRQVPTGVVLAQFPYNVLPPIPMHQFQGDFAWLPEQIRSPGLKGGFSEEFRRNWYFRFSKLVTEAKSLRLNLPPSFLKYMLTDLRHRADLDSCWEPLPDTIAESPKGDGGRLFAFTMTGQAQLVYYLYLKEGVDDHCICVSWDFLGIQGCADEHQHPEEPDNIFFCAPSFEAFVYRRWIEWEIMWALTEGKRPLNPDELEYADYWKAHSHR